MLREHTLYTYEQEESVTHVPTFVKATTELGFPTTSWKRPLEIQHGARGLELNYVS